MFLGIAVEKEVAGVRRRATPVGVRAALVRRSSLWSTSQGGMVRSNLLGEVKFAAALLA